MIKTVAISAKQIDLLSKAQAIVDRAQSDITLVAATILAGLNINGQIVGLDAAANTINIDVPDEEKKA